MIAPRTETRRVTVNGSGRRGGWAVPARAPRSRGPGFLRDGAGDGAGQDAAGQDVGDRAVQPQRYPLPGQRQPGADDVVASNGDQASQALSLRSASRVASGSDIRNSRLPVIERQSRLSVPDSRACAGPPTAGGCGAALVRKSAGAVATIDKPAINVISY
jgi:hypothetical protein